MIEHVLRCTDLLDEAVSHDNDPVAQCHSFDLVMCYIDECCIDPLTELDDLCSHLVTELSVQVGKGLIHEEHLWITHDGTSDRNSLSLTA